MQAASQFCFSFDFDEWATLARTDPAGFEARRFALIENYLRQFPPPGQHRLRGLQFRIDMERRRARTPMAACLKLSAMMWDSLLGSRGLKSALEQLAAGTATPPRTRVTTARPHGRTTAQILPFRKPAR